MRVLFVNVETAFSGAEVAMLNWMRALQSQGITVVMASPRGTTWIRASELGIERHEIPPFSPSFRFGMARLSRELARIPELRKNIISLTVDKGIDIIHANGYRSGIAVALSKPRCPVVLHVHSILNPGKISHRWLLTCAATRASVLIAVSKAVESNIMEFGVHPGKVRTIYNGTCGFRHHKPSVDIKRQFGFSPDCVLFGMVGQIAQWKGQLEFVQAAALALKESTRSEFAIVGDIISPTEAQYRSKVLNEIERLGLSRKMRWLGFQEDIASIMAGLDVIVHCSVEPDPLPTVIIEAFSLGKPVIATAVGGVPELVLNNTRGFLVAPGDIHNMASKIKLLTSNKELREQMGREGKAFFLDALDEVAATKELINVYTRLVRKG